MKKFIIDRSIWRTGDKPKKGNCVYTGEGETKLLNQQGFMCCLGMVCEQMGVPRNHLLDVSEPEDILTYSSVETISGFLVYKPDVREEEYSNTVFACDAMNINDDVNITSEERETKLKEHFATKEIEIEFINNYTIVKEEWQTP
jgi:hypothetical protein